MTPGSTVLTIGKFDGVHRGHRALVRSARASADRLGAQCVAVILYPHPASVLAGVRIPVLSTPAQRADLIRELGADQVEVMTFDRALALTMPSRFVQDLVERFSVRRFVVGPDFRFGRDRGGNTDLLSELGAEMGFDVEVFSPLEIDGSKASSGRIRDAIREGDVASAGRWLGRPPQLSGTVVHGAHRGRTIGFPTANLELDADYVIPADGVYAVRCTWSSSTPDGERIERSALAAASIGIRPTFDSGKRSIEAFLLDFDEDLYGAEMVFEFIAYLRPELRFDSVETLVEAIEHDVEAAREVLTRSEPQTKSGPDTESEMEAEARAEANR